MPKNIVFLIIFIISLSSCVTTDQETYQTVLLDEAIRDAADHLEGSLEQGTIVALLNFTSPSETFSAYVLDELTDYLVNGRRLIIVDRAELDLIRQEENFHMSGEVSDATAISIGQKLGTQIIVSGSLVGIGQTYRIRIRALKVETAVISVSRSSDINPREERVRALLGWQTPDVEIAGQGSAQTQTSGTQGTAARVVIESGSQGYFRWERDNLGVTITSYTGSGGVVTIPSSINGIPVIAIGDNAFNGSNLSSISIPNSVITIGVFAFGGNELMTISIPNSVTYIGEGAFIFNQLTSARISNSVTFIGEGAFAYNRLTSINIPNSITSIAWMAFADNHLTSVNIPNSVTSIEGSAFHENGLSSIIIPESVTSIGEYAFAGNRLTSITIGANVWLGQDVFGIDMFFFENAYNGTAGTYTRANANSSNWTRM